MGHCKQFRVFHAFSERIYDIVLDYPASTDTLAELHRCMRASASMMRVRRRLMQRGQVEIIRRLLQPGDRSSHFQYRPYYSLVHHANPAHVHAGGERAASARRHRRHHEHGVRADSRLHSVGDYSLSAFDHFHSDRPDSMRCIVSLLTERGHLDACGGANGRRSAAAFVSLQEESACPDSEAESVDTDETELHGHSRSSVAQLAAQQSTSADENRDPRLNNELRAIDSAGTSTAASSQSNLAATTTPKWLKWTPDPVEFNPGRYFTAADRRLGHDVVVQLASPGRHRHDAHRHLRHTRTVRQRISPASRHETADGRRDRRESNHGLLRSLHLQEMKETRYLEVLRGRFAGTDFDQCDVMLADMAGWARGDRHVHDQHPRMVTNVRVLSEQYWPKVVADSLTLPRAIDDQVAAYNAVYGAYKPHRRLECRPQLGTVALTLRTAQAQPLTFNVTPVLAAIVLKFLEKGVQLLRVPITCRILVGRRAGHGAARGRVAGAPPLSLVGGCARARGRERRRLRAVRRPACAVDGRRAARPHRVVGRRLAARRRR